MARNAINSYAEIMDWIEDLVSMETLKKAIRHDIAALSEVNLLIGDASKAKAKLGWSPKVTFEELVQMMYENDLKEEAAHQFYRLWEEWFGAQEVTANRVYQEWKLASSFGSVGRFHAGSFFSTCVSAEMRSFDSGWVRS